MIRISGRQLLVTVAFPFLVLNSPSLAAPDVTQQVKGFPTAAEVANICSLIDANFPIGELRITDLASGSKTVSPPDPPDTKNPFHAIDLKVTWDWHGDTATAKNFKDESDQFQSSGTPGWEAVVASTGTNKQADSNVYCYSTYDTELEEDSFVAPGGISPAVIAFFYGRGACLLPTREAVYRHCKQYNHTEDGDYEYDPEKQKAHYTQELLVKPFGQPVNMCGCAFADTDGIQERPVKFCTKGSCPKGQVEEFSAQSGATIGNNTCEFMEIFGTRYYYEVAPVPPGC